MIKMFKKNFKVYFNRVIAIITMQLFMISLNPVYSNEAGDMKDQNNSGIISEIKKISFDYLNPTTLMDNEAFPLILSYTIDKNKNFVLLSWNTKEKPDNNFYVFKKIKNKNYELLTPEGTNVNYYIDKSALDKGASFIVVQSPDLKEYLNKDNFITRLKHKQIIEYLKSNDKVHIISNEVVIDMNSQGAPLSPVKSYFKSNKDKAILGWVSKNKNIDKYLVYKKSTDASYYKFTLDTTYTDKDIQSSDNNTYYVWAFDKTGNASPPLILTDNITEKGVFNLDKMAVVNNAKVIDYKNVKIDIPLGSFLPESVITIVPLKIGNMQKTPDDTPNVTCSADEGIAGYDISLNGDSNSKFLKDIKITMKYDKNKIPKELKEDNVFLYYYNELTGQWENLKREDLNKKESTITCSTYHFCQFYVGTMNIQSEPPQAKGINTTPKNIQEIDPMDGIKEIKPPAANNYGSAVMEFPIQVPEGINGLTPNVKLVYNSAAKYGNCGVGWNLATSSITIKTKNKGVPKYDGNDIYMLDGEELVKTGETSTNRFYRAKVDKDFSNIVYTKGLNYFVVYKTDGARLFYGTSPDMRIYNPDNEIQTYAYYLTGIFDKFNNYMHFQYIKDGNNCYLTGIIYSITTKDHVTGNITDMSSYKYLVQFSWMDRSDVRSSLISGFKVEYNKKLSSIDIYHKGSQLTQLKTYSLTYSSTHDNLLENIKEMNGTDIINEYQINYNKLENDVIYTNNDELYNLLTSGTISRYKDRYIVDGGIRLVDLDGDGLTDVIRDYSYADYPDVEEEWINSPAGWKEDTQLGYDYKLKTSGNIWRYKSIEKKIQYDGGIRFIDLDGDGRTDVIKDFEWRDDIKPIKEAFLNNGIGWRQADNYKLPTSGALLWYDGKNLDCGVRFVDLNGDGLLDVMKDWICVYDRNQEVYINTGSGWKKDIEYPYIRYDFKLKTSLAICHYPSDRDYMMDNGIRFIDLNGDGLSDVIMDRQNENNTPEKEAFLNTGTGWVPNNNYILPEDINIIRQKNRTNWDCGTRFVDLNGDGLIDIIRDWKIPNVDRLQTVYINTGSGWKPDNECGYDYKLKTDECINRYVSTAHILDGGVRFIDLNGDGLIDMVQDVYISYSSTAIKKAWLNNGYTWVENDNYKLPTSSYINYFNCTEDNLDQGIRFIDLNGDGQIDMIRDYRNDTDTPIKEAWINNNKDLLINSFVNLKTNNTTSLTYDYVVVNNSIRYKVLSSVTTGNSELSITTTFDYADGLYDKRENEFRGFKTVITKVKDKAKELEGREVYKIVEQTYKVDTIEDNGVAIPDYVDNLPNVGNNNPIYEQYIKGQIDTEETKWLIQGDTIMESKVKYNYIKEDILNSNSEVKTVYCNDKRIWIYDENGQFIGNDLENGDPSEATAITFDIDKIYGLPEVIRNTVYNDPIHDYDNIKNVKTYIKNSNLWVNVLHEDKTMLYSTDESNPAKWISVKKLYYDNNDTAVVTTGKLYKEVIWNNNGTIDNTSDDWYMPVSTFYYDCYGNLIKTTDNLGLTTKYTHEYFETGDFYKKTVKYLPDGTYDPNKLTEEKWNDIYGRLSKTKDIYDDTVRFVYDTKGRLIQIYETVDGTETLTKDIQYSTEGALFKAQAKFKDDSSDGFLYMQYYKDSLGRMIQVKKESTVDGIKVWTVNGKTEYDAMGRSVSTSSVTTAPFENENYIDTGLVNPLTTYQYDDRGRICEINTPTGLIIYNTYSIYPDNYQSDYYGNYTRILIEARQTDSMGHDNLICRDLMNNDVRTITKIDLSSNTITNFEYTLQGKSKVIESASLKGEKQVDSTGNVKWIKSPDRGKVEYIYQPDGLTDKVYEYGRNEADYRIIDYTYNDPVKRITQIDYPGDDNDIEYFYYGMDSSVEKYEKVNISKIAKGHFGTPNYFIEYDYN